MKKEVFISLMETCLNEYKRKETFDQKMEEAFGSGSDTRIISDLTVITDIIDSICKEYKDSKDTLYDYVFMFERKGDEVFSYNGVEYKDTLENNWLLLEGKLDKNKF